jgi:hypothetical protein
MGIEKKAKMSEISFKDDSCLSMLSDFADVYNLELREIDF